MNRAQNADHTARTCERFVYPVVKITRLYDYQTWQTHFVGEIHKVCKGIWSFFSLLYFLDAVWLGRQTVTTWIFPGCGVIKHDKFYTQLSTWLVVCIIHMYLELTHFSPCGNCFSQSLTLLLYSTVHQVFKDLDFLGWYTTGGPPTMNDISVHKQVCDQENPKPQQLIKYKLLLSIYSQLCVVQYGETGR